jgi:hypothetical protein
MSDALHPAAPHHLPAFITAPGETDWLMVGTGIFLIIVVLMVGNLFLRLHTLPERLAHKSQKLQFEIVAVLGLLALFTHIHAFWVAGLLLALVDLPDFGTPLRRIARSTEKLAGLPPDDPAPGPIADPHASDHAVAIADGAGAGSHGEHGAAGMPTKRSVRAGPNQELIDA